MSETDNSLLQKFVELKCEDAFTVIVSRHINLVYSAAFRQVRDHGLAEDVVQSVFTDLARAAGNLGPQAVISAWLYQVTRRTAIDLVRQEARRVVREQIAMKIADERGTDEPWVSIAPVLDESMMRLQEPDRTALVIRFFDNRSLSEVGSTLGISEDAAQKRIQRALDRLRTHLTQRGVATESVGLGVVLTAQAVAPAPTGLAATIAAAAVAQGVISTSIPVAGGLLSMTSFTKATIVAVAAATLVTLVYQFRAGLVLNRENTRYRSEVADLEASRIRERDEANARVNVLESDLARLRSNHQELLRLRGMEAERLRNQGAVVTGNAASGSADVNYRGLPARNPSEALERFFRASVAGDEGAVIQFSSWRRSGSVPDEVFEMVRQPNIRNTTNTLATTTSLRVLESRSIDSNRQRARLECTLEDGKVLRREMEFLLEDGQWRPAFVVERSPAGSFSVVLFQGLTPELGPTE